MHTVFVLLVGLGALGVCALLGHVPGGGAGTAKAALVFLPLWFSGAGINMYLGVKKAGYSISDEAPIFLLVF